MSSYHSSFKYLDKKSDEDFGWIIAHFDPDNGETDSNLSQDQIYTDSYNGTKRTLYGTRWNSVASVKITVIKQNGSDFSLSDCRDAYKWLTGNPEASWMDLYVGDQIKYRLLCTIQDVKPQKLDARTVGLNIYCESLSPWAYSPHIVLSQLITGSETINITNESDDLYTPVYLKAIYENASGKSLIISNTTIGETTEISDLSVNETVTLDGNMLITSDKPSKIFGNSFNYIWPRLKAGENSLEITGNGNLTFEYSYPIKMGDCAITLNQVSDPICAEDGSIQIEMLPWSRISDTPNSLRGYGILDAYTKSEVDQKVANVTVNNVYTKSEIDAMLENFVSDDVYTKMEIDSNFYTKSEVDAMLAAIQVNIDEAELNTMLAEVLI